MIRYFWNEPVRFESHDSAANLTNRIDELLKKTYGFNFSVNLYGKMNERGEFWVSPKYEFIQIKGSMEMSATIYGTVAKKGKGSVIEAKVRANWVFFVLAIAMPLIMLAVCVVEDSIPLQSKLLICAIAIIMPVLLALFSKARKNALVNNFAKAFNLRVIKQ